MRCTRQRSESPQRVANGRRKRQGRSDVFERSALRYALAIEGGNSFSAARPIRLIERRYFAETAFLGRTYDVSPDGQRFLMIRPAGGAVKASVRSNIIIVQGWFEELKRLSPAK